MRALTASFLVLALPALAFIHSASADPATSDQQIADQMKHSKKRVSTMVPWGIPTVLWTTCSAGLAQSKALDGQVIAVTARHCVHKKDYGATGFDNPRDLAPDGSVCRHPRDFTTYASGSIQGLFFPRKGFAFDINKSDVSNNQDLVVTPVSTSNGEIGHAQVLTMADDLPEPGRPLHFWGYPQIGIPMVGNVTHQTRFDCVYLGPVLVERPDIGAQPTSLYQLAECSHHAFVDGMQGGPVTDENGHFVGTLVNAYNPAVHFGPRGHRKTMLIFNAMTNREIMDRKAVAAQTPNSAPYRVFPHLEGHRRMDRVLTITYELKTVEEFMGPEYVGEIHEGAYDIPFKNDVVDGELTVFNSSGQVDKTETWSNGKLVKKK